MPDRDAVRHHGSHQRLLWAPGDTASAGSGLDAIIVPTVRRPAQLAGVIRLAEALRCPLVTLHSGKWTSAGQATRAYPGSVNLVAIDIPDSDRLNLPSWKTSRLVRGTIFERRSDLSAKRNLALMLSHMAGWSRVLFLDDDITGLVPDDVRRAAALLGVYNAVGLEVGGYPDNSVVCHAYRQAGGQQQSFIGGGALAVQVQRCNSFFPEIYNDDWFFLLDGDKWLQPSAVTGKVIQAPYDPFRTPDRARAEEFGDVLAEGLFWLLDQDRSITEADEPYWARYLGIRRRFVESVLEMVRDADMDGAEKERRVAALKGALGRLALIRPDLCYQYLRAWIDDRETWRRHVELLPTRMQLQAAVAQLSRRGLPRLTWYPGHGAAESRPAPVSAGQQAGR